MLAAFYCGIKAPRHPCNLCPYFAQRPIKLQSQRASCSCNKHARVYLSCLPAREMRKDDGIKQLRRGKHSSY